MNLNSPGSGRTGPSHRPAGRPHATAVIPTCGSQGPGDTRPTNQVAPAVLTHPGAGQGGNSSMTEPTVPTDRPARRHQPEHRTIGVSPSFSVDPDDVTVTGDGDMATIQVGTGTSFRLFGPREDLTNIVVECYRQLCNLPYGLPARPERPEVAPS